MIDRPTEADIPGILSMVAHAGVFTSVDVECVGELLDDYVHKPGHGGYEFIVDREDGRLLGLACYGSTPLTEGTFDLYWLCVAAEARRGGVARRLVAEMEADLRRLGARLLVVETSGSDGYRPARAFYLANGFQRQATIPDYYAPGDDLVVYTKRYGEA
ncbi:MAG TPA: GNAT family N-acetyltransferase [Anaerolineae bacterium]|nr:GNAT family N-acetyltransferase [Anaerolineae bacterium]HOR00207.1 GNAT family N-acetyltransferase [Anaerolineae bacterium]HPL28351.1 GNAT family N-acetyltransferase [Anaerolineae bacterium]